MKTTLFALALAGLAAAAPVQAQSSCASAKKAECSAKAELATVKQECSSEKKTECSSKAELASAKQECSSVAKAQCESKAELASAQECKAEKTSCASGELASAKQECSTEAKAQCSSTAALASSQECATKTSCSSELATVKQECSSSKAALATAEGDCATKTACSTGELASAGDGQCSSSKSLAKVDGGSCGSAGELAKTSGVIGVGAQLASLIQPERVVGIVVDGKAYLGKKAMAQAEALVRAQVSTNIAAHCEASAKCEATLAKNVAETMAGQMCMVSELTSLVEAGKVHLIVGEETVCSKTATAMLASVGSCPDYKAECAERAGVAMPSKAVKVTMAAPSVDNQLAALFTDERVAGFVVDGKAYVGAEAASKLNCLIRSEVSENVKANCEASAKCDATLASNVDKMMAGKVCAGSQLASMIEAGRIESVLVGNQFVSGCEAKTAVTKIMSCPNYKAECQQLATATVDAGSCSSSTTSL